MSARRKSRPAVSLFEFLAVLVCAMGALILLLLVTTRRIRQQALEEINEADAPAVVVAVDEPATEESEIEVTAVPLIVLATPDSDAPRWSVPQTVWEPAPVPPAAEPDPYAEAVRRNEELRREWQTNVINLESRRTTLEQNWEEWQATLSAANRVIQNLAAQSLQLDNEARAVLEQQAALDADAQRLHQSHAALTRQIDATATQLQVVRDSPTPAAPQYSILPYDYSTGTSRRPIIIECTANEIRFASESVFLSAGDIQGFTPSYNPLQAGADVLVQYWNQHDTQAGAGGDPYILLVVRPGGTISYYIARKLLESVGERFGYELVGADQQFAWPESTPEATRLCREAVESCLADRNRVRDRVGGGDLPLAGPLQFMDSRGNFYLDEVAQLQGVANDGATGNGGSQSPGSGPDRGDLSAIFGAPVDSSRPGGSPSPPEQPAGRTHQLHQPQGTGPSSQGESQTGQPHQGQPQAGQQQSGQPNPGRPNQSEPQGTQPQQGGNSPSRESQGGNPGQGSGEGPPRQSSPAGSPSWIERPRGPDSSPSYRTHPGLFGEAGTGNAPGRQSSMGSTQPLVIETSNPSGNGGTGNSGTTSANTSPAPVVRGLNEPGQPQGTLGYQRDVYIYIDGTSFQVAGEQAVGIASSMSREQVTALLAERLRSRMATWEAAPEGGTWVPRIRFEIRRGGNAHLRQLTEIVSEWQINWSANYTSE